MKFLTKRVLCFGDSHTWGLVPTREPIRQRYPVGIRWTGRIAQAAGPSMQIIEEGLPGRTTGLDDPDPSRVGKNGYDYLGPCLESHNPLDMVVLMLGTNDLQKRFGVQSSVETIVYRMGKLVQLTKKLAKDERQQEPIILLLAPPHPRLDCLPAIYAEFFQYLDLEARAHLLTAMYQRLAKDEQIHFFNAAPRVTTSTVDGIHMDASQHALFAQILFPYMAALLKEKQPA